MLLTCFHILVYRAMTVTTVHKDDITEHVEEQTYDSDNENIQSLFCLYWVEKPLHSFNQDAEHQGSGKDRIAKGSYNISPQKAICVALMPSYATETDTKQANNH